MNPLEFTLGQLAKRSWGEFCCDW